MKQLKRQIRTCCSSIMSVLVCTIAEERVPRILILLHARARTKMMFEIIFARNIITSIAYQPRSISSLNTYSVSSASAVSPSSPSPPIYKALSKVMALLLPSSSSLKNSIQIKIKTIVLNKVMAVFSVYFQIPSLCGKC